MIDDLPPPPPLGDDASLFLDFDGTLAEFVSPDASPSLEDGLRRVLRRLAERLDGRLAIVSGRALDNLITVVGIDSLDLCGSHGDERLSASGSRHDPPPHARLADLHSASREFALANDLLHEEKPAGATFHYRGKPEREEAVRTFADALARQHGFELLLGSMVAEVRAPGRDKGDAVRRLMAEEPFRGGSPIFVGDDLTDEDGFAAASRLGGSGVLVGPLRETSADYRLPGVAAVIEWLNA